MSKNEKVIVELTKYYTSYDPKYCYFTLTFETDGGIKRTSTHSKIVLKKNQSIHSSFELEIEKYLFDNLRFGYEALLDEAPNHQISLDIIKQKIKNYLNTQIKTHTK